MTDSMKFGPEWIRNLSETCSLGLGSNPSSSSHHVSTSGSSGAGHSTSSSTSSSSTSVRYTLAEHRYGREEMLALYSSNLSPPESLKALSGLYVEKSQQPLALFCLSDDEIRLWNRGVNPDGLGRGNTGKGPVDGSTRGRRDGGREGRGRGRGGGTPGSTYFPRPPGPGAIGGSYPGEPNDPANDAGPFIRNRPTFERQNSERSWSERNGGIEGGTRGRGGGDTNWRRHRGEEDPGSNDISVPGGGNNPDSGWRPQPKWQHPGRSWRKEDSWTDWDPRMSNHHLPEWAIEKNESIGCGGSFENGAFQGDDIPPKRRDRPHQSEQKSKLDGGGRESESSDSGGGGGDCSDRDHDPSERESQHHSLTGQLNQTSGDHIERKRDKDDDSAPNFALDDIRKQVDKLDRLKSTEQALELSEIKRQLEMLERQQQQSVKQQHSPSADSSQSDIPSQQTAPQVQPVQVPPDQQQQISNLQQVPASQQQIPVQQQTAVNQQQQKQSQQQQVLNQQQQQVLNQQQQQAAVLQQQAISQQQAILNQQEQQQQQAILNQQQVLNQQPPISPIASPQQVHQPLNSLARLHQATTQPLLQDPHLDDHSINDNIATDLVAKLMEDEEKRDKQWYYKDPQGQVQGPFSCGEMAEWFQSGYFTLGLMVKRACDPSFSPLGELIKIWGCIPFLTDQPQSGGGGGGGSGGGQPVLPPQPQDPKDNQVYTQLQDVMMQQIKLDQYHHRQILFSRQQQQQQQAAIANRNQSVKLPNTEWPEHLQPADNQQNAAPGAASSGGGQQASLQLRALLAQMQAHQQMKQQQTSKVKEPSGASGAAASNSTGSGGGGAVMETLMSLHQQQVAQQAALQQALQAAKLAESQGGSGGGAGAIRTLVNQMQQGKLRWPNQQSNIDSVWNGGNSWKQWSHVNPKAIKTEQQVLEEQMRAEDERKREEIRKQEEAVRISEEDTKERKRDKQDEKSQNERNKRESDDIQRRRLEEEELRRKQEAVRRAEVDRQRKEEDKRKKEEDKRRKEDEKRKHYEERERLKLQEDERKKKEAEEAKKRQQDLMSKIQRAQWCPPQASNTSLLEIQRSEREQVMRSLRDQEAAAAAVAAAEQAKSAGLHLKWTEQNRSAPFVVESLAEIQAQQYRQFVKVQEKEKAEREKKESVGTQPVGGTWSQGLNWGALPQQPVWHNNNNQGSGTSGVGFWDQLSGPKQPPGVNTISKPVSSKPQSQQQPGASIPQPQQPKETKSKSKREEMAVMQLFGSQARQDEFTRWCQHALSNLPMTCPFDIPTFVSFLRDIESSLDVLEYIRNYVGDSKEATEFARQFLERRHSLMQSSQQPGSGPGQQPNHPVGPLPVPNPTLSPHSTNEDFQQVKSKGKNKKKGRITKMQTVDPRILGFSSTASADRINVGDREYPEDM